MNLDVRTGSRSVLLRAAAFTLAGVALSFTLAQPAPKQPPEPGVAVPEQVVAAAATVVDEEYNHNQVLV